MKYQQLNFPDYDFFRVLTCHWNFWSLPQNSHPSVTPLYTWYMILNTHTHELNILILWCLILIYSSAICHCSIIHITKSNILHKYIPKDTQIKSIKFSCSISRFFNFPFHGKTFFFKSFLNNQKGKQWEIPQCDKLKRKKCVGKTISTPKKEKCIKINKYKSKSWCGKSSVIEMENLLPNKENFRKNHLTFYGIFVCVL